MNESYNMIIRIISEEYIEIMNISPTSTNNHNSSRILRAMKPREEGLIKPNKTRTPSTG
jgi:hypothetical protein